MMRKKFILPFLSFWLLISTGWQPLEKPTVYLIGDSTVDDGSGNNGLWGWGKYLPQFFDSSRIRILNYAQGGTSARTFQTNGIWDKRINKRGMWDTVASKLKKGDYLIIQFGLNDAGKIDDSTRSRGTLHGIGKDSVNIYNYVTKQNETVYSFGWYLTKFIRQASAKGVEVIVCSSIPRNIWKDGKIIRGENGFAEWALQVAAKEKVASIDLNALVADRYDQEGERVVTSQYHFGNDNTHTTESGAILNASLVAKGIGQLKTCSLKKYINTQALQDQKSSISYSATKLNSTEIAAVKKYAESLAKNFDPKENMVLTKITAWQYHIDTVGATYHHVWSTFNYARALLNTGDDQYIKTACDAINAAIALQDTNQTSRTYGLWPYYKEEPLATKKTPADFNMADFFGVILLDIYMGHQNRLPAKVLANIKTALIRAARCDQKRNQSPDYTNIAVMGTYLNYMVAHLFDIDDLKIYANQRLKTFYDYTMLKKGFTEYNSPNYTITALKEISRMRQHIVEPGAVKMIEALNEVAWDIIARHYHKPTGQWAGPHSRSYSTLLNQDQFLSLLYFASGGKIDAGKHSLDVNDIVLKHHMPEKFYPAFLSPSYPRTELDLFEPSGAKITGTTYLTDSYVISSANRSCLWNQRRPLTAYWGSKEKPHYFQVQFLHNGYDFSSAAIFTSQHENQVLAGINLFLYGGNKHLGLDPIKTGKFTTSDLRIRFHFGASTIANPTHIPSTDNQPFSVRADGMEFLIHLFKTNFDKQPGYWEKGNDNNDSWIDYVLYTGKEKEIDLTSIQEAFWAFTVTINPTDLQRNQVGPRSQISNKILTATWKGLEIAFPTNLLPLGGFPKNL